MEVGSGAGHAHTSDEVTSESEEGWKAGLTHASDCILASIEIFLLVALSHTSLTLDKGFILRVESNDLVR